MVAPANTHPARRPLIAAWRRPRTLERLPPSFGPASSPGYADRLAADEIPIGARIIAVCDAYEAIISSRPYRAARSPQAGILELRRCVATPFDPHVVAAFEAVMAGVAHVAAICDGRHPGDICI